LLPLLVLFLEEKGLLEHIAVRPARGMTFEAITVHKKF
jgi:hypothetical protein